MRSSKTGLPNGLHIDFTTYDLNESGILPKFIKNMINLCNTAVNHNEIGLMCITDIRYPSNLTEKEIEQGFINIFKYFDRAVIFTSTNNPIGITCLGRYFSLDTIEAAMMLEKTGFRAIGSVCDIEEGIPYLFINDASIPVLYKILDIELNKCKGD